MRISPGVKCVLLFLLTVCPSQAALLAHVQTSCGAIQVELQYDKAPQAVANFMTLACATRTHLDPESGALSHKPFYVGEKFFRVVDEPGFRIAQTGSGTGTNRGGPGFSFKDEFHPELHHVSYVLSMANSGPNTNGSQIFFTGSDPVFRLDGVHTIFGLITDGPSRGVIDAVIAAGSDGASITGITFERTDTAAVAFNEFAQSLPTVICPKGELSASRYVATKWALGEPLVLGDVFRTFRSTTLAAESWEELENASVQIGIQAVGSTSSLQSLTLDSASAPTGFFNLSCTHHPGSVAPTYLNTRPLLIEFGGQTIQYNFNITGSAATAIYTPVEGEPLAFSAVVLEFHPSAHSCTVVLENVGINPRYLLIRCGWDSVIDTIVTGRHSTSSFNGIDWLPWNTGTATFTR